MVTDMKEAPISLKSRVYRTIWRWHFYAGLFVIPFVLLLAVTGAAYLFKPQVERWEERVFQDLPVAGAVAPQRQVDVALAAFPGASFNSYRLPERTGDAAMIHLAMPDGRSMRDVFVSPQGEVLGSIVPDTRLMAWVRSIHGQLLLGKRGSWLVELAAGWAIVLVLSGLYLWWPKGQGRGRWLAWFCRRGVAASQGRTAHVLARSPRCDWLLDFRPRAGAAGDGAALGGSVGQRLQGGPHRNGLGRWSSDLDAGRRGAFVGWW